MLQIFCIAQKQAPETNGAMQFSVGLVIVCLLVLILLWLPDLLRGE